MSTGYQDLSAGSLRLSHHGGSTRELVSLGQLLLGHTVDGKNSRTSWDDGYAAMPQCYSQGFVHPRWLAGFLPSAVGDVHFAKGEERPCDSYSLWRCRHRTNRSRVGMPNRCAWVYVMVLVMMMMMVMMTPALSIIVLGAFNLFSKSHGNGTSMEIFPIFLTEIKYLVF